MREIYRLRSIRQSYGTTTVLEIDDLSIPEGRLYHLIGPNGAGKSTLLNLLAFLVPPASGEILYAGTRIDWNNGSADRLRRAVTLLHQSPFLFGGTVNDNVAFGLAARGIRGEERRRAVERALSAVSLEGFGGRKARELSGGEAQRVAMARALAISPEVLLLDEPLSSVDRETSTLLESVIASLPGQGTTVIMVTHDPDRPERLRGEPIRLERGRIVPPVTPSD